MLWRSTCHWTIRSESIVRYVTTVHLFSAVLAAPVVNAQAFTLEAVTVTVAIAWALLQFTRYTSKARFTNAMASETKATFVAVISAGDFIAVLPYKSSFA
jgi:hypothetical protein